MGGKGQASEAIGMKFKKEITIVVEGEIYDKEISIFDLIHSIKWSYKHWWEGNPNWPYGKPSSPIQAGRIDKISMNGKELKDT